MVNAKVYILIKFGLSFGDQSLCCKEWRTYSADVYMTSMYVCIWVFGYLGNCIGISCVIHIAGDYIQYVFGYI